MNSPLLDRLIERAHRRSTIQLAANQAVIAIAAAFAGAVLLLIVGTQILDWYWLALVFAACFGWGLYRMRAQIPSRYRIAQVVDERLDFADTLSTAYIYQQGGRSIEPDLLGYQTARAESLAATVDAGYVFPLGVPRAMWWAGAAALAAFAMFGLRYGVTHSLDLKPSLVKIAFDTFWKQSVPEESKSPLRRAVEDQLKKIGIAVPEDKTKPLEAAQGPPLEQIKAPEVRSAEAGENMVAKADDASSDEASEADASGEKGDRSAGADEKNPSGEPPTQAAKTPPNSMLDKMKDAFSDLMKKMNLEQKGGQKSEKGGEKQAKAQQGKSAEAQGKQSQGADSQDPNGEQRQGQGQGEQSQNAQSKTGDKGERSQSSDSKSGIGKDDGDKTARQAEQLAAMGKISEILGKRAKDMSGEIMVEVSGGNQGLRTAYTNAAGKHVEAGGEINRDEVPLAYRDYVRGYFEQVHKPSAAPPPPAK